MSKRFTNKISFGDNDGLNPNQQIIKEQYKNFQLVAPISPYKKRLGIMDAIKNTTTVINKNRLSEQLNTIKIGFIQTAFQEALLNQEEQASNKKPDYDYQISYQNVGENKDKIEQSPNKDISNNKDEQKEKEIIYKTPKKSIFKQIINNEDPDKSNTSIDSESQSDEDVDQVNDKLIVSNKQNKFPNQEQRTAKKSFISIVDKIREANRKYQWKFNLISKLGISKQNEEKFSKFLSKNQNKVETKEKIKQEEDGSQTKISERNNYLTIDDKQQIRKYSFDKNNVQQYEKNDYYDEILNKEKVLISNIEDGWMVINILKKPKKTKNEKLFLQRALENINLFQKHKEAVFKNSQTNEKLYESLGYKYCKKNEVVFHFGDDGDTYYIVLRDIQLYQGQVSLLLPKSNEDVDILEEESELRRDKNRRNKLLKNTTFFQRALNKGFLQEQIQDFN